MTRTWRDWGKNLLRAALDRPKTQPLSLFYPTSRGDAPVRGTTDVLDGYGALPWLRAAAGRIAASISSVEWEIYAVRKPNMRATRAPWLTRGDIGIRRKAIEELVRDREADRVQNHPMLDLLHDGNITHTGVQLWRITQASVDLVGESYWLLQRNGVGAPVSAWPVPSTWVLETPTPERQVYRLNMRGHYVEVPATEMIAFIDPHPANPYGRGSGIAHTLGDELGTDEYAAKLVRQFFLTGARPDFLVYVKDQLGMDPAEKKRWEEEWRNRHSGYARAFEPYFAGQELGVHEFSKDFQAMQFTELRKYERDTIVQVFGVPPEILGIVENSNRATIDGAEYIYARQVLVPRLELIRSILQARLVPLYDDRIVLDYVSPIPNDRTYELDAAKAQPHALTINEWRSMSGHDAIPTGDVHLMPAQLQIVENFEVPDDVEIVEPPMVEPPAAPKPLPTPPVGEPAEVED